MAISDDITKRLMISLTSATAGNTVADALNAGLAAVAQNLVCIPLIKKATSTSTTTDWSALAVGDLVLQIKAADGTAVMRVVVTAGTHPAASVVDDYYLVFRAYTAPTASAVKF